MNKTFLIDILIATPVFYLFLLVAKSSIKEWLEKGLLPMGLRRFMLSEVGRPLSEFLVALWFTIAIIWLVMGVYDF